MIVKILILRGLHIWFHSQGIYILIRLIVFYSSFTWKHWIGLLISSGAYKFTYDQISGMAKPAYDDSGELIDGGSDMKAGGLCR
jgi:hypothetical protein